MKQHLSVVGTVIAVTLTPGVAQASTPHPKKTYLSLYKQAADRHGTRAPGRNIVKYGIENKNGARAAKLSEITRSIGVLKRMLYTPPPPPVTTPVVNNTLITPVAPSQAVASKAAVASINKPQAKGTLPYCTWGPESGGNYHARNPSGAGGKYQIMPGTWKAYGGKGANAADAPPAEQERVAHRIYAAEGGRPWVNC